MAVTAAAIAGYVILGVGGLLLFIAIILIIVVVVRRKKDKYVDVRAASPDQFKVVYNAPVTSNGGTAKIVDALDSRSIHSVNPARSDTGYVAYVSSPPPRSPTPQVIEAPPQVVVRPQQILTQPVIVKSPPPVAAVNPLPRALSVDQLNYSAYPTMPRTGYRYAYPAGTTSRVLVPISKKQAKRIRKESAKQQLYVNPSGSRSVLSVPKGYATSVQSGRSGRSTATSVAGTPGLLKQQNKYFMYGSTPNLHARQYTQPVLMYDGKKKYFFADELNARRNENVQNWLYREAPAPHSPSATADDHGTGTDADGRSESSNALHLRWSPRMRRKLDEKDQRASTSGSLSMNFGAEEPASSPRYNQSQGAVGAEIVSPTSGDRVYTPLYNYPELSEV